ncbi:MAG: Nramp family divalent metal transporter [Pirellulaceae bacterium]
MQAEAHHGPTGSTGIPPWTLGELPEPKRLSWRNWRDFIGPGIVMMGIQIGGGEWLLGPAITAKYGGGLMWIATIAILLQVFYNMECGRYALYCGEPVLTGFMRCRPGPRFWVALMLLLNASALIPGLSTHGAAMIAAILLQRPPDLGDRWLVVPLAYACMFLVALPVVLGGKVYSMLQAIMTAKIIVVLGFCLTIGLLLVDRQHWWQVLIGFLQIGNVPVVADREGEERIVNAFGYFLREGQWPDVSTASLIVIGAFAGYAGGGGLANSTYSSFVRDKGWGMGARVGAIPSAIGGREISLSHVGEVFPIDSEQLRRWKGWWKYVWADQMLVWAPGCFVGMALPALLSLQFAPYSTITSQQASVAQAVITADGMRHAPVAPAVAQLLWIAALLTGLMVMLPSQLSILDDFSRRWTDALWTANRKVRDNMKPAQVGKIYYALLAGYLLWSFLFAYYFNHVPKVMTEFIANFNNLAIGITAFQLLWINHRLLPKELRPGKLASIAVACCGIFYLGLAGLVFFLKILPSWIS